MTNDIIELSYGRRLDVSGSSDIDLADSITMRLGRLSQIAELISDASRWDDMDVQPRTIETLGHFMSEIAQKASREVLALSARRTATEPAPLDAWKAGLGQVQEGLQRMRAQSA